MIIVNPNDKNSVYRQKAEATKSETVQYIGHFNHESSAEELKQDNVHSAPVNILESMYSRNLT